jgi:hypothetical protein
LLQALLDFCHTVLPARNPDFSVVEMPPLLLDPRVRADLGRDWFSFGEKLLE